MFKTFMIICTILYFVSLVANYFIFMAMGERKLFDEAEGVLFFIIGSVIPIVNFILMCYSLFNLTLYCLDEKDIKEINSMAARGFRKPLPKEKKDHL